MLITFSSQIGILRFYENSVLSIFTKAIKNMLAAELSNGPMQAGRWVSFGKPDRSLLCRIIGC